MPAKSAPARVESPPESLNSQVSGFYERQSKSAPGRCYVLQSAKRHLKFKIECEWVGNPGKASVNQGTTHGDMTLNAQTYNYRNTDGPYILNFKFTDSGLDVTYRGTGFGGMNVSPEGHYVKVNSNKPQQRDLTETN